MRAGHNVRDELRVRRVRNRRLKHANDGGSARIHPNLLPDHRWIAMKRCAPEAIGKHRCACSIGPVVAHVQQSAQHGAQAHDFEVGAIHNSGANFTRLTEPNHREPDRRKVAKLADRFHAGPQVLDFRHRKTVIFRSDARGALSNVN